jgi:hypothetical protein
VSGAPFLSIVIPVHDEQAHIGDTIARAAAEADRATDVRYELIVVDDGSTDDTAHAARVALQDREGRLIAQPNRGRFHARRAGLEAARGEFVLFLDSRVRLEPDSLRFAIDQVRDGRRVWNAHVIIETRGNPYGSFWLVLTELAFSSYFSSPRTTSYGTTEFDQFPKGTTCFLAPRELLLVGFDSLRTRYADARHANDYTPIIRSIASRERIWISPSFVCRYWPRATLRGFLRHAHHRGIVFLDGHGRRESRFFPLVAAFYPLCAAWAALTLRWPLSLAIGPALVALVSGAIAAARRQPPGNVLAFASLAPVYAAAHASGMWRGVALALGKATMGVSRASA